MDPDYSQFDPEKDDLWDEIKYLRKENTALNQRMVDDWNRRFGSDVIVDVRLDDGSVVRTVTRSSAAMMGDRAVIWLNAVDGGPRFSACYALDRVTPLPRPTEDDEERLEYTRASGDAECQVCGKFLRHHPSDLDHPDYEGRPFLVKLCDGSLVKL